MIVKTSGVALRHDPVFETSRVILWLTPDFGPVATLAKGAHRPKSPFLGQFDLFYTCEILFYHREGQELFILRECCPLNPRSALRTDWRAAAAASYFCGLITRALPRQSPHPEYFHLLEEALDDVQRSGATPPLLFRFELRLLLELGLAPRLDGCLGCGRTIEAGRHALLSPERGGLLCPACGQDSSPDLLRLAPDILATLRAWQRARSPAAARATRCSPAQTAALRNALGAFLLYHLDPPPVGRDAALDALAGYP